MQKFALFDGGEKIEKDKNRIEENKSEKAEEHKSYIVQSEDVRGANKKVELPSIVGRDLLLENVHD